MKISGTNERVSLHFPDKEVQLWTRPGVLLIRVSSSASHNNLSNQLTIGMQILANQSVKQFGKDTGV